MSAQRDMTELEICLYQRRYCMEQARRHQKSNTLYARDWVIEARRWGRYVVREIRWVRDNVCNP